MLRTVERFLRDTEMKPATFGRRAVGDPRLVHDLRNGRELRPTTRARIQAFIEAQEKAR